MVSEAVTITAITTIGGMIVAYIKHRGDRREKALQLEIDGRAAAQKEANKQREAQTLFNEELILAMSRAEQKVDALTDMHMRTDTPFATTGISEKVGELHGKVDELDKKSNIILTNTEIIKSKSQGS